MDNNITTTSSATIDYERDDAFFEARIMYGIDDRNYGDRSFDYDCEVQELVEIDEEGFVTILYDGTFEIDEYTKELITEIEAYFISNYFHMIADLQGNEFDGTPDRNDE